MVPVKIHPLSQVFTFADVKFSAVGANDAVNQVPGVTGDESVGL